MGCTAAASCTQDAQSDSENLRSQLAAAEAALAKAESELSDARARISALEGQVSALQKELQVDHTVVTQLMALSRLGTPRTARDIASWFQVPACFHDASNHQQPCLVYRALNSKPPAPLQNITRSGRPGHCITARRTQARVLMRCSRSCPKRTQSCRKSLQSVTRCSATLPAPSSSLRGWRMQNGAWRCGAQPRP